MTGVLDQMCTMGILISMIYLQVVYASVNSKSSILFKILSREWAPSGPVPCIGHTDDLYVRKRWAIPPPTCLSISMSE